MSVISCAHLSASFFFTLCNLFAHVTQIFTLLFGLVVQLKFVHSLLRIHVGIKVDDRI